MNSLPHLGRTLRQWAVSMAMLAAVPAWASPTLSLMPVEDGGAQQMVVEGLWAARCLPAPANAWARGQDIYFELRQPRTSCGNEPKSGFELRSGPIDLPATVGTTARVWRLHLLDADEGDLLAFALQGGAETGFEVPESGLWWPESGGEFDTSGPGLGAQIEIQGRTVALNVSGYDEQGAPTWWFGAAPLSRPGQAIELSALSGGAGPFADYAAPKQVGNAGTLHVEWLGSARAVFWFTRQAAHGRGLELRPVSMTRFAFGVRPGESWVGDWVLYRQDADGASRAEIHRFEWLDGNVESFELVSDGGLRLACRRADGSADRAPKTCQLLPLGGGKRLHFANVGLDGMSTSQSGEHIALRRLR